jgi:hypothetical protein
MTDKPRTMMLSAQEWRALILSGLSALYSRVEYKGSPYDIASVPSVEQMGDLQVSLDRLKMQVSAWGASGQQPAAGAPVPEHPNMTEYLDQVAGAPSNGTGTVSAEPKRKRGWQKGRKRGPRKPKQTEAVQ